MKPLEIIDQLRSVPKNKRLLAKAISIIENDHSFAEDLLSELYKEEVPCRVIGVTGAPGSGKSTLINNLLDLFLSQNKKIAVIAIDPSSPFTGGAILGDRIRMQEHAISENVFIRSMGSRGALGGLSVSTLDVVNFLRCSGFDIVIVETVGVGQSEIDIAGLSDAVLLVLAPGSGDEIQILKAGIIEIADIYIVNKADKEGKDKLITEIKAFLSFNRENCNPYNRIRSIVETVSTEKKGIHDLAFQLDAYFNFFDNNRVEIRSKKLEFQIKNMVQNKMISNIDIFSEVSGMFSDWCKKTIDGKSNPYLLVKEFETIYLKGIGKKDRLLNKQEEKR